MAAMNNKIISIILLFFALVFQCYSQCQLSDLKIEQEQTGVKVKNKQEWRAFIITDCICNFPLVALNCSGFQTVEPIDPSLKIVRSHQGKFCLVADGNPITKFRPATFRYASDSSFPFDIIGGEIYCP
ncbi:hypothetical protein HN51_066330 [Arachis hypogaea]|uniref:Uncharacterized protein n=1 Tax=Arachis hypogaea TaxID=3818 RepID=A0A444ZNB0_ARAHY|nr:uncharacterized protein DS421_14g465720 [Arachis hypogaea]RYR15658.1 hypothetical protein Ahy_B04g072554 [Arachis hypogaea]